MSMDLLERLHLDVAAKLSGEAWFSTVPVVAYRKFQTGTGTGGELEQEEIWRVKKDGTHSGVGVRVGFPRLRVPHTNLMGPQLQLAMVVTAIEQPVVSEGSLGLNTQECGWKSAEKAALIVTESLHNWRYDGANLLRCDGECISVNARFDPRFAKAYDVLILGTVYRTNPTRSNTPQIGGAHTAVTITAGGADSIYYTTDESLPSPSGTLYSGAFAVASGTLVRAISVTAGKYNSDTANVTV